jgi:predicted metal-dependent enzyme (double-stranded beta helix superfamily)
MSRLTRRPFRSPALRWLTTVAQGWAEQPAAWRPLVHHHATGRWVEPLLINEHSEVWLQGWPVGEHVELHDHGGASGALCVVHGELAETYAASPDAPRLRRRRLRPGGLSAFGPDHVHDVVNTGRTQALSIQVYSPRLVSMTFYALRRGHGLEAVRTELSDHPVIVPTPAPVPSFTP